MGLDGGLWGCFGLNCISDCRISDSTLDKIVEVFVSTKDVFYFDDDGIANACLHQGIPVHTRQEFASMFPMFALVYGSVYHLWNMNLPKEARVLMVHPSELRSLSAEVQMKLLIQQVQYGRGHIYEPSWLAHFDVHLPCTICLEGKSYGFLTWDDWWTFSPEVRRQWVLEWLREWRKEDAEVAEVIDLPKDHDSIPYELLQEYAGTFSHTSTANCFAAAIAMVVGKRNLDQSRLLIEEWLHQGPFFRLLHGQGYAKHSKVRSAGDLVFRPCDVLVWYTGDGVAGHAAYAVSDECVFQKQGQGWDNPWQVLRINNVWYNDYLKTGGHIELYRQGVSPLAKAPVDLVETV